MHLEIRRKAFGFGYQTQRWPATHHRILTVGTREVRVIIPHGVPAGILPTLALLTAGLFLS